MVKFIQDSLTENRRAIGAGGVAGAVVPEDDLLNKHQVNISNRQICKG